MAHVHTERRERKAEAQGHCCFPSYRRLPEPFFFFSQIPSLPLSQPPHSPFPMLDPWKVPSPPLIKCFLLNYSFPQGPPNHWPHCFFTCPLFPPSLDSKVYHYYHSLKHSLPLLIDFHQQNPALIQSNSPSTPPSSHPQQWNVTGEKPHKPAEWSHYKHRTTN